MTSEIKVDTISENTSANGVTIDGLTIKDGNIIGDVALAGTTPTFTIGDAGAEDAALIFDGNQVDFVMGVDDSADEFRIGVGTALGSDRVFEINSSGVSVFQKAVQFAGSTPTVTIGDGGAEDTKLLFDGNAQNFYIGIDDSADDLLIGLGSTVGTTPAIAIDENNKVTLPDGAMEIIIDGNYDNLTLISTDADANAGPNLRLYRNSGSPADNDILGNIDFSGRNDNSEDVKYGYIEMNITDASDGSEDGYMSFNIMQGGANNPFFQMKTGDAPVLVVNENSKDMDFRVEGNGNANMLFVDAGNDQVTAGATSNLSCSLGAQADGERALFVVQVANSDTTAAIWKNVYAQSSQSATMIAFTNSENTEVGSIKSTGSATAFNTSSDYRLKENVDYTWDATTRLKQLKPARFNWVSDSTNTLLDGFLAHEVSSIVPEAITGTKDAATTLTKVVIGEHGNVIAENIEESDWTAGKTNGTYDAETTWHSSKTEPTYQQIDQAKLVPLLVKTIQELEARITTLEG